MKKRSRKSSGTTSAARSRTCCDSDREPSGDVSRRLLAWYRDHGHRDLPWQREPTPYRVWVSEALPTAMEWAAARVWEAEPGGDPIPHFVERDLRKYLDCGSWHMGRVYRNFKAGWRSTSKGRSNGSFAAAR